MEDEEIKNYITEYYQFWYYTNKFYYTIAKKYGITDLELLTLDILYENKECIQSEIDERLSITKQTLSSLLNNLENKGFIEKKINPKNKRNRLVSLTKKGLKFSEPILKELYEIESNMIRSIPEEELKTYLNIQKKFYTFIDNFLNKK